MEDERMDSEETVFSAVFVAPQMYSLVLVTTVFITYEVNSKTGL